MKSAIVLLSGGIDSTTTLAVARDEGFEVYALSFDYHQRHRIELDRARKNARRFKVNRHLIMNFDLGEVAGSALTSDVEVPKGRDISALRGIPVTYVPARNVIFLSFALAWAETIGSEDIFIGANAIDYSGYPDCRPAFIKAFEEMANLAMKEAIEGKAKFKIHTPLIHMSKAQIIKKGLQLGVDFSDTWSCYDPQADDNPCMSCDSCLLRKKGFKEAGIEDPLILKVKH